MNRYFIRGTKYNSDLGNKFLNELNISNKYNPYNLISYLKKVNNGFLNYNPEDNVFSTEGYIYGFSDIPKEYHIMLDTETGIFFFPRQTEIETLIGDDNYDKYYEFKFIYPDSSQEIISYNFQNPTTGIISSFHDNLLRCKCPFKYYSSNTQLKYWPKKVIITMKQYSEIYDEKTIYFHEQFVSDKERIKVTFIDSYGIPQVVYLMFSTGFEASMEKDDSFKISIPGYSYDINSQKVTISALAGSDILDKNLNEFFQGLVSSEAIVATNSGTYLHFSKKIFTQKLYTRSNGSIDTAFSFNPEDLNIIKEKDIIKSL